MPQTRLGPKVVWLNFWPPLCTQTSAHAWTRERRSSFCKYTDQKHWTNNCSQKFQCVFFFFCCFPSSYSLFTFECVCRMWDTKKRPVRLYTSSKSGSNLNKVCLLFQVRSPCAFVWLIKRSWNFCFRFTQNRTFSNK